MKKLFFVLMILVCALLFSCATDSGVDAAESAGSDRVLVAGIHPGSVLNSVPEYTTWAAKYVADSNPSLNGITLIPDNAAFDKLPADIQERKQNASELADQNRFIDAWYAYGEDDNEYIIALKAMFLLDNYTDSIMHQMFVLSNLNPDQDLFEYRQNYSQGGKVVDWDPVEVIEAYVNKNCNGAMPHILEMALGCYYQACAEDFGDEWVMPMEDAYELSVEYFEKAIEAGVYNDYALFRSIDAFLCAEYLDEALAVIHCLEINEPEFSYHYYREALAYIFKGEYQHAMPCGAKAALCGDSTNEMCAGALIFADSVMYDNRNVDLAVSILAAVKPYTLDVYYNQAVFEMIEILMFANQTADGAYDERIIQEMSEAFAFEPYDSDYLWTLSDYYYSYDNLNLGIAWISAILPEWEGDNLASGRLNFELGQMFYQQNMYQKALNCFNDAETQLKAADAYDDSVNNIPYYQNLCREQLIGKPQKNKV